MPFNCPLPVLQASGRRQSAGSVRKRTGKGTGKKNRPTNVGRSPTNCKAPENRLSSLLFPAYYILMRNSKLKDAVMRLLPKVQTPAQYLGGELNSIVKDHARVRGKLCLAFPDAYTLGMSHHGLQVLYTIMNNDPQWACERAFTPWIDFEKELRQAGLPLYSLATFTPLCDFDVIGFSLQYEICYTNVLTMLDLGRIPLHAKDRTLAHPLVITGGPGAQNPELLGPFADLFVI